MKRENARPKNVRQKNKNKKRGMGSREWGVGSGEVLSHFPLPILHSPFPIFPSDIFRPPRLYFTCQLAADSLLARMAFDQFDADLVRPFDEGVFDFAPGDRANLIGHLHAV